MEIIIPHRIKPQTASICWSNLPRIVPIALRQQINEPIEFFRSPVNLGGKLLQKWRGRWIHDRVDGVEPERVEVKVGNPLQGVFDEITPYFVAAAGIEVERLPPRRLV